LTTFWLVSQNRSRYQCRMKTLIGSLVFFLSLTSIFSEEVGVVTFIQGNTTLSGPRNKKPTPLKINQVLRVGDKVTTMDGTCEIQLATQATIRMEKYTSLSLDEILNPSTKRTTVKAYSGKLFVKAHKQEAGKEQKLSIVAPSYVAGVRGTEFIVALPDAGGTNEDLKLADGVYVNEGTVAVGDPKKKKDVLVEANEEIVVSGSEFKKQILNEYAKEKMIIFEHLKQIKEENYNLIKEQNLKNSDLIDSMKGKTTP